MTNLEQELQIAIDRDTLVRISVELDTLQKEDMIVEFKDLQIEVSKKEIKKYFNEEYSTVRVSNFGGFEAYEKAKKPVVKKRMGWSNHSNFVTGGNASSCDGCQGGPCSECRIIEQK